MILFKQDFQDYKIWSKIYISQGCTHPNVGISYLDNLNNWKVKDFSSIMLELGAIMIIAYSNDSMV